MHLDLVVPEDASHVAVVLLFHRESFPMILVANKVDLMHLRKITREQGKEMATKHNVGVCACAHRSVYACVRACLCVCVPCARACM